MKSSFSIKFNTLRKERKLSIREVALMTGVSTREVKKWEKGSSLPADTRVMEALVGLLGEEISREFSTIEKKTLHEERVDQSLFSLDESKRSVDGFVQLATNNNPSIANVYLIFIIFL